MKFPKPEKKKKKSKRRAEEQHAYSNARKIYLRQHPTCEVCEVNQSTQIHHTAGRINNLLNNEEYWYATCQSCHEHIHANPKWAYENGFLLEKNRVTEYE